MGKREDAVLLVVDDEPIIVRLIIRSFRDDFGKILYCTTPDEAEQILAENRVTHFICDENLGSKYPPGHELVIRWQEMYSSIEKTVVFTGMDISDLDISANIEVFSKGGSTKDLLDYLKESFKDSLQGGPILS